MSGVDVKWNINNRMRVKLRWPGLVAYCKFMTQYGMMDDRAALKELSTKANMDGTHDFQGWWAFQMFGPTMNLGCNPPFDTTVTIIGGDAAEDER